MEAELQNTSYDYLYAAIQTSDWIEPAYKKLAEKYRKSDALKELYMCICDNVSIDLIEVVPADDKASGILSQYRKQQLKSEFRRKYQESVERLEVITETTGKEVKKLTAAVEYITENMLLKDELFFVQEKDTIPEEESLNLHETNAAKDNNELKKSGDGIMDENVLSEALIIHKNIPFPSRLAAVKENLKELFHLGKGNHKKSVMDMLSEGYKQEQITFVLQCMSEGMTEREIDEISDPSLAVEHMELLKKIKEHEKNEDGKRN